MQAEGFVSTEAQVLDGPMAFKNIYKYNPQFPSISASHAMVPS